MLQRQPHAGSTRRPRVSLLALGALAPLVFVSCSDATTETPPDASSAAPAAGPATGKRAQGGAAGGANRAAQGGGGKKKGFSVPPLREYPPIEESPAYEEYQNARAFRDQRQLRDAARSAQAALKLDPERSDLHALMGEILVRQGNYTGAREAYQLGIEHDRGNGELWHNLGLVNYKLDALDFAERCFVSAVAAMPEAERSWYQLGLTQYRLATVVVGAESLDQEKMKSAIGMFQRTIELAPKMVEGHLWAGVGMKRIREYEGATGYFENVLVLDPKHVDAHIHLAECALQNGDPALCEQYYTAALELDPSNAHAHVGIARLREFDSELEAALASYEAAVEADPTFQDAYYGLSQLYLRLGREDEANEARAKFEAFAKRAERQRESDDRQVLARTHEMLYESGISYQMAGDLQKAEKAFREVLELAPEHSKALTQLGSILRDRGELESALDYFRRSYASDVGNSRARKFMMETEGLLAEQRGTAVPEEESGN